MTRTKDTTIRAGDCVRANWDIRELPTGNRPLVVVRAGWKRVRVLDPYTLKATNIPAPLFHSFNPRPIPDQAVKLAQRIRTKAMARERKGIGFKAVTVKRALEAISRRTEQRAGA